MMVKKSLIAAAMVAGLAQAAQADDHMIVLTGFSYFPAITYVSPGDTVVFINSSGEEQTVVGADAGWTVGPLSDDQEGSLVVTEETELRFFAAYQNCAGQSGDGDDTDAEDCDGEDDYGSYEEAPIRAEITFDAPPLNG